MFSQQQIGKLLGVLLLTQVIAGLYIQFGLMQSLLAKPGFLYSGFEPNFTTGTMVLLSLGLGCINLLIATLCHHTFRHRLPILTQFILILAGAKFAISMLEISKLMEMVSYAKFFSSADQQTQTLLKTMSESMIAGRNWAHYLQVTTTGLFILSFYFLLFKGSNISKVVTSLAMLAVSTQIIAVIQPFFGNSVPMLMLAPIGIVQLLMPIYFIVKGINLAQEQSR